MAEPTAKTDQCEAHCRGTTRRCTRPPSKGQRVCASHGGSSPQAKRKADERATAEGLRRTLAERGIDPTPVTDPLQVLLDLAGELLSYKDWCREQLERLEVERHTVRFTDERGGEQLRSEVAMYERAMRDVLNHLATIAKLNIDQRMVAIEEAKVDLLLAALDAALDPLELPAEQHAEARERAALHLIATG